MRGYRSALEHHETMDILNKMKYDGFIDDIITADINQVLSGCNNKILFIWRL